MQDILCNIINIITSWIYDIKKQYNYVGLHFVVSKLHSL